MKGKFVASARHLGRSIWKNRACYSLMLPGIIWFILFAYGPMSGLLLAFKTYSARGGIWGSVSPHTATGIFISYCKRFYLLQKQGCAMRNNSNFDEKA